MFPPIGKTKFSLNVNKELKEEELSLINVGELLNDFDWKGSGNAAALEERLLNELAALEAANIHAMVESDDRIHSVIEQIDNAIAELDNMDQWLSLYTAELNVMIFMSTILLTFNFILKILRFFFAHSIEHGR